MTVLDKGGGDGKMVQTRPRQSWKKAGAAGGEGLGRIVQPSFVFSALGLFGHEDIVPARLYVWRAP